MDLRRLCKKSLITTILSSFFAISHAQDVHFSQFYAAPLLLNPALTGHFDGDWRLVGNYRDQWRSIGGYPFTTAALSFDMPFQVGEQQLAGGIQVLNDKSGIGGLTQNRFLLSLAWAKRIDDHKLRIGVQGGLVLESIDFGRYTYNNQFDLGGSQVFNSSNPNGEDLKKGLSFVDINAGALWSKKITDKFEPEAGFTLCHINRPLRSFYNEDKDGNRFGIRKVAHLGGTFALKKNMRIKPNILYMFQRSATDFLVGGNFEYDLKSTIFRTIFAGTLVRYGWSTNFDASAWIVGCRVKNVTVGLSYDINLSSLSVATYNRGAFEISIIYINPKVKPAKIKIPCDRI